MKNERCDYCGKLFDKPSFVVDCSKKHRQPDFAQKIVDEIEKDISDRRGLKHEWSQIQEEIQEEIREVWAEIVRNGIRTA